MAHKGGGYPSNWIRKTTRLAVYLRDGLCCVYCGAIGTEHGLTIDHINGRSAGNNPENLATSCLTCNRLRQARAKLDMRRAHGGPLTIQLKAAAKIIRERRPPWYVQLLVMSDPNKRPGLREKYEDIRQRHQEDGYVTFQTLLTDDAASAKALQDSIQMWPSVRILVIFPATPPPPAASSVWALLGPQMRNTIMDARSQVSCTGVPWSPNDWIYAVEHTTNQTATLDGT